jgi:hypothetical protein
MSFIRRKIDVQIVLNGDTFDGSNDTITLTGLRVQATLLSYEGGSTPFVGSLQMRISGMLGDDMAKLSTLGLEPGIHVKNVITVTAGDDVNGMSKVFSGGITNALVDYNAQPDVGVDIVAYGGYFEKMLPVQGRSTPGTVDVAEALSSICSTVGWTLVNNGVTAKLSNHCSNGTTFDQISDICSAAGIRWSLVDKTVYIWPKGGQRDDTIIDMSPATGMVGYPMYTAQGIDVISTFNPAIEVGRRMKVSTSVPNLTPDFQRQYSIKANPNNVPATIPGDKGTYFISVVRHDIESETPNGRWFTRSGLSIFKNVARTAP